MEHRICLDFNKVAVMLLLISRVISLNVNTPNLRLGSVAGALEMRVITERNVISTMRPPISSVLTQCRSIREQKDGPLVNGYDGGSKRMCRYWRRPAGSILAEPKCLRVTYTLTACPDRVPAGKMGEVLAAVSRRDVSRQQEVRLVSASEKRRVLAPDSCAHSFASIWNGRHRKVGRSPLGDFRICFLWLLVWSEGHGHKALRHFFSPFIGAILRSAPGLHSPAAPSCRQSYGRCAQSLAQGTAHL